MANITPRRNKKGEVTSYTIRVFRGYDNHGKQLKPYITSVDEPDEDVEMGLEELR